MSALESFVTGLRGLVRRLGPVGLVVVIAGVLAGILMIATEFSTLFSAEIGRGEGPASAPSCADVAPADVKARCEQTGREQHSWALGLIGLLTIFMAIGAGAGRSRPAALALVICGLIGLGITLLGDLPDSDDTGLISVLYEDARGVKGTGFWLELTAAPLAILAGALALSPLLTPPERPTRKRASETEGRGGPSYQR